MTGGTRQKTKQMFSRPTRETGTRRMWAPMALMALMALLASACGDELRFDLDGDIAVDIVDDTVIGSIDILRTQKCGDLRMTSITGTGTVPYGNANKTANYNIALTLNDLCHYTGVIKLGFPGEPGDPYPICEFVQFDNMVPVQRDGLYGIGGFGFTDQNCRSTGPVTLRSFLILDENLSPHPS